MPLNFMTFMGLVSRLEGMVTESTPWYKMCYGQETPNTRIASLATIYIASGITPSYSPTVSRSIFHIVLLGAGYVGLAFLSHRIYVFAASALLNKSWLGKAIVLGVYSALASTLIERFIKTILFNDKPSLVEELEETSKEWAEFFKKKKELLKNLGGTFKAINASHIEEIKKLPPEACRCYQAVNLTASLSNTSLSLDLKKEVEFLQQKRALLQEMKTAVELTNSCNEISSSFESLQRYPKVAYAAMCMPLYTFVIPRMMSWHYLATSPIVTYAFITPILNVIQEACYHVLPLKSDIEAVPSIERVEAAIASVKEQEEKIVALYVSYKKLKDEQEIAESLALFFEIFNEETTGQA